VAASCGRGVGLQLCYAGSFFLVIRGVCCSLEPVVLLFRVGVFLFSHGPESDRGFGSKKKRHRWRGAVKGGSWLMIGPSCDPVPRIVIFAIPPIGAADSGNLGKNGAQGDHRMFGATATRLRIELSLTPNYPGSPATHLPRNTIENSGTAKKLGRAGPGQAAAAREQSAATILYDRPPRGLVRVFWAAGQIVVSAVLVGHLFLAMANPAPLV